MHRVLIYCCVWGVTELKRSIFTRCHSHSGRIINTQTHSHTYWVRALGCVRPHCVHADTHIQLPARSEEMSKHSRRLLTLDGLVPSLLLHSYHMLHADPQSVLLSTKTTSVMLFHVFIMLHDDTQTLNALLHYRWGLDGGRGPSLFSLKTH